MSHANKYDITTIIQCYNLLLYMIIKDTFHHFHLWRCTWRHIISWTFMSFLYDIFVIDCNHVTPIWIINHRCNAWIFRKRYHNVIHNITTSYQPLLNLLKYDILKSGIICGCANNCCRCHCRYFNRHQSSVGRLARQHPHTGHASNNGTALTCNYSLHHYHWSPQLCLYVCVHARACSSQPAAQPHT